VGWLLHFFSFELHSRATCYYCMVFLSRSVHGRSRLRAVGIGLAMSWTADESQLESRRGQPPPPPSFRPILGPPSLLYIAYMGAFYGKRGQGCEIDHHLYLLPRLLYIHFPRRLQGMVLKQLSTGATASFTSSNKIVMNTGPTAQCTDGNTHRGLQI
jgi:hypothetical protein